MVTISFNNHKKHINIPCRQEADILNFNAGKDNIQVDLKKSVRRVQACFICFRILATGELF
jgi:hypothetical protein